MGLTVCDLVFSQGQPTSKTVMFTSEMVKGTCVLMPVKPIHLGSLSTRSLATNGAKGPWGSSRIEFTDCNLDSDYTDLYSSSVYLTIQPGTAAPNNANVWSNKLGNAKNVGIELMVDGKLVGPKGVKDLKTVITGSTAYYAVRARMVATGKATEGEVATIINFVADYK